MTDLRWHFAPDADEATRGALVRAFQHKDCFESPTCSPVRGKSGRRYGLLNTDGKVPFRIFVKAYGENSIGSRLRGIIGRCAAKREFENAVALRQLGVAVPRPLAVARDRSRSQPRCCYLCMEYVEDARTLLELIAGGEIRDGQWPALAEAVARLLVDLASRGVWHKDVRPANLIVRYREPAGPPTLMLVDVRHVAFSKAPLPDALEHMLSTLCGFLMAAGIAPPQVRAIAEAAARIDRREQRGLLTGSTDAVLARGRAFAQAFLRRARRKGRLPASAADAFAARYATAEDAANYRDRRFARSGHGRKVDAAEREIVEQWLRDLPLSGPVLDIPCGAGRLLPILAARAGQTIGADVAPEMIHLARQAAREAGVACSLLACDARRLPVADGTFDLVMSMRLLHRIPGRAERIEVLKELARTSRKWILF
ncbi:MAG: methyltransferase domain-containing protein, partial [Planctomycetota bacterium]|nr:methyltransferase domain-containing protein [Planctomycetota bacterium]